MHDLHYVSITKRLLQRDCGACLWLALVMRDKAVCVHDENTKHEAEQYAKETH